MGVFSFVYIHFLDTHIRLLFSVLRESRDGVDGDVFFTFAVQLGATHTR